jgi:hypothetical protein
VPAHNSRGGLELFCTGGVDDQHNAAIEDLTLGPFVDVRFATPPEQGCQPTRTTPGSQRRQQSRRGRSACCCQDGTGDGERCDSGRERGRKRANPLPVVAQAHLDAGQLLDVAADGARTGRCDLLLRQEAYASTVDPRGSQLSYSSLEFNFALQRASDLSQLAHYRHPLDLLFVLKATARTAPAFHE